MASSAVDGRSTSIAVALVLGALSSLAAAQESQSPPAAAPAPAASEPAHGILPVPDYSGDVWTRRKLLGDFGDERTKLANKGIQFGIDFNQYFQSVVTGGRDNQSAYGGTFDYNMTIDLMRMGVLPGALVTFRAESRYGDSVNADAGPILPVNSDASFPLAAKLDEHIPFTITTLSYTQFLSETFGVFFGKFDTLDGDANEFASGRGLTQFQNLNFIFSPTPLVTVPYSTLGGGLLWKPMSHLTLATNLITTADSSTTTGFDKIGDGWTWGAEAQFQYRLGHLPGGVNVGGAYAFANEFSTVGRRFTFESGTGIVREPGQDTSWAVYASFWQYLFADEPAEKADEPLNLIDGKPDRKGMGIFGRIGFADQDTNPIELALSGGVGGRGIISSRPDDLFGVGYFYNQIQTTRLKERAGAQDSYSGLEAFYNIAITPAAGLTFDVQVVEGPTHSIDTAVVLGMRLLLRF